MSILLCTLFLGCFSSQQSQLITEEELETVAINSSVTRPERVKARHILIAHKNALNARSKLRRTREEAREMAYDLFERLESGADFAALSQKYGNDPTAGQGGKLGVFGPNQMMKNFSALVFQLQENEMGVCETIFGYHIVQRLPLQEIVLRQLVIQWKNTYGSTTSRTQEEARILIEKAYAELEEGATPSELIKEYSDGMMASRGGLVGFVEKEKVGPALRDVAFSLKKGEHSAIVQSNLGYHIVFREDSSIAQ